MDDLISRQAVLDKAYAYGNGLEPEGYCVNVEDIQALPPVTPTILDKIRAEIEEQVLESLSDGGDDWFAAEKVNECLEIIDKYKAGNEK